jgi:hypothetical protein
MYANDTEFDNEPSLATVWPVFAKFALVPFLGGIAVLAYNTVAWETESDAGLSIALACLFVTVALVTLLAPLIIIVVYYSVMLSIWLGLFVFVDELPLTGWPGRVRTILRSVIILASVAGIAFTIPQLFIAPTWKAFKDAALAGVIFPASTILCLFMSRFERTGKALAAKDAEDIRQY